MKKLIFTTVLMLSLALVSYSKPANKDNSLVKGLATALKNAQNAAITTTSRYKKTSFDFNGKTVSAYFDIENDELVGFSIPMVVTDLPKGALDNITGKYSKYSVVALIMFIQKSGYYGFYVSLSSPKVPTIVVSVNANGKTHYFGKM